MRHLDKTHRLQILLDHTDGNCFGCEADGSCDTIAALRALEAAESEVDRLTERLEAVRALATRYEREARDLAGSMFLEHARGAATRQAAASAIRRALGEA
jgi:hypothetical protein